LREREKIKGVLVLTHPRNKPNKMTEKEVGEGEVVYTCP